MRKFYTLLFFICFCSLHSFSQAPVPAVQKAKLLNPVKPVVVYAKPNDAGQAQRIGNINEREEREDLVQHDVPRNIIAPHFPDPVWQKEAGLAVNTISVLHQFDGFNYTNVNPPDPSGDVGIDRVVTSTNGSSGTGGTKFAVYDKNGNVISASVSFNNIVTPTLTGGSGDPIILFDEASQRWFISEMVSGFFRIYVSQTSNPIGAYFRYIIPSSGTGIPDYPKYGIWNNKLVITTNQVAPNSNTYVLDKNSLVAGTTVTPVTFMTNRPSGYALQNTGPADVDGSLLPDANSKAIILRHRDDEINPGTPDNTKDFIEYWELDINFANPGSSTMTGPIRIDIAEFDTQLCGLAFVGCFEQPGTTTRLMPIREMMMYRVQYRRFPTHESIVLNFVTDVSGTDRGGIRWVELRKTTGSWFKYQEGTFAPNDGLNRWMGSIAQDKFGNIAMGYAVSSSTKFPSLRITGRKAGDPLGVMTEPETEVAVGTNRSLSIRWGDYFHLALDPISDEDFWMNGMYSTGTQDWRTRVAHFKFNNCLNPFNSSATTNNNVTCFGGSNGSITATPLGGTAPFSYQLNGGTPQSSGTFNGLAAGNYTITVTDAAGCSSNAAATVTQPLQISINKTIQQVLCNGASNGIITINASNTTGAVTYQLNANPPQTSNVFNNLAAGTYIVTVRDGNNCFNTDTITVTQPAAISSAETKTDVACFGGNNGSVTIIAAGGTSPYQYRIGTGALQTSNVFNNLSAGNYNITIVDANNCSFSKSVAINQPAALTNTPAALSAKCFGEASGSITINASGGVAPYQYRVGSGTLQAANVFNSIAAGSYNVIVRDANGCETTQSVTVNQPSQINAAVNATNPEAANRFKGSLKIDNVTGGTAPYQFAINGGAFQTGNDFSKEYILGQNTITVKDANGCTITLNRLMEQVVTDDTWKSFTKLYPNPNFGNFYLEIRGIKADQNFQVQVFDAKGALVQRFETGSSANGYYLKQLNMDALNAGVYTMKIVSLKNKGELLQKFVVSNR